MRINPVSVNDSNDLILALARQQWRLLLVSFVSAVFVALTEGLTLGVLFLAVEALASPTAALDIPIPFAANIASYLSAEAVIIFLMFLAVILQGIQSLMRYFNKVSIGYFSSLCKSEIYSLMHSLVLSFSFPCASKFKIGELTNYSGVAPGAVQCK